MIVVIVVVMVVHVIVIGVYQASLFLSTLLLVIDKLYFKRSTNFWDELLCSS